MINTRYTKENLIKLIDELKPSDVLPFVKNSDTHLTSFTYPVDLADIACAFLRKLIGNEQATEDSIRAATEGLTECFLPLLKGLDTQLLKLFIDRIMTRMGDTPTIMLLMIDLAEKSQPNIHTYSEFFDLTQHFARDTITSLLAKQNELFQTESSFDVLYRRHDAASLKMVFENYIPTSKKLSWLKTVHEDVVSLNDEEFLSFLLQTLRGFIPDYIHCSAQNILNHAKALSIPIIPEDAICHPERSEGSPSNSEIPRYARNDNARILKSNGYISTLRSDLITLIEHTLDKYVLTVPLNTHLTHIEINHYLTEVLAYSLQHYNINIHYRIDVINALADLARHELEQTVLANQENLKHYHLQCLAVLEIFTARLTSVSDFGCVETFLNHCHILDTYMMNLSDASKGHPLSITMECAMQLHSAVSNGDQVAIIAAILPNQHRLAYVEANNLHWRPRQETPTLSSPVIDEVFSLEPHSMFASPTIERAPVMPTTPCLRKNSDD